MFIVYLRIDYILSFITGNSYKISCFDLVTLPILLFFLFFSVRLCLNFFLYFKVYIFCFIFIFSFVISLLIKSYWFMNLSFILNSELKTYLIRHFKFNAFLMRISLYNFILVHFDFINNLSSSALLVVFEFYSVFRYLFLLISLNKFNVLYWFIFMKNIIKLIYGWFVKLFIELIEFFN